MKNCLILIIICLTICACVSPYQGQANFLNAAYQRGEISANDYHARMTELQSLDLQRRQAAAQAWQQGCNNLVLQGQARQQALSNIRVVPSYQPSQPVTTYGTITAPSGRMYQYNSTSY